MTVRSTELAPQGNKVGRAKTSKGEVLRYEVTGELTRIVGPKGKKKLVLQQVRFTDGKQQLRLGYYVLGQTGDRKDSWIWGRNAPFLDASELQELVGEAKKNGWI